MPIPIRNTQQARSALSPILPRHGASGAHHHTTDANIPTTKPNTAVANGPTPGYWAVKTWIPWCQMHREQGDRKMHTHNPPLVREVKMAVPRGFNALISALTA